MKTKISFSITKSLFGLFALVIAGGSIMAQGNVILTVSPDNCMNPVPNSGTYVPTGTLNGKTAYYKNPNLRIVWTGTAWEVQGDDPGIGGVTWITGWNDTANTPKPPAAGWVANFGCFPITMTGDVSTSGTASADNIPSSGLVFSAVYPNPAAKEFSIDISNGNNQQWILEVYDILGNQVLKEKHKAASGAVTLKTNMEALHSGMYFVRLLLANGTMIYTARVIRQ